jgi:predicted component of type VI protein secretion system
MNGTGAKLVVHGSLSAQDEYELPERTTKIGREAFNDIVLYDPEVSRNHAHIKFHEGRYIIEDLGSTNGTFVNGRRITAPVPLHDGDAIEMGEGVNATFYSSADPLGETIIHADEQDDLDKTIAEPESVTGAILAPTTKEPVYEPPPAEQTDLRQTELEYDSIPQPTAPPEQQLTSNRRRYFLVSGCLFFLFVVACAASLFLLDSLAPDFLYCGPARPLSELVGLNCS